MYTVCQNMIRVCVCSKYSYITAIVHTQKDCK